MGDRIRMDKSYYSNHRPQRFDIIAVRTPLFRTNTNTETVLVKRVIAFGNEVVEIKHGVVFINGSKLEEPYTPILAVHEFGPVTIPNGEYFLLGDNRPESSDSRFWKPPTIKDADIVAKVTDIIHH
ncbi:MAG: signal peptidase [Blastocatellia bacterium]|nr:signal peptidase [Blastocatellia bacterium]